MCVCIADNVVDSCCDQVISKYPVIYMESMNTVLRQELIRYNRLIEVIRTSLHNLSRAVKVHSSCNSTAAQDRSTV